MLCRVSLTPEWRERRIERENSATKNKEKEGNKEKTAKINGKLTASQLLIFLFTVVARLFNEYKPQIYPWTQYIMNVQLCMYLCVCACVCGTRTRTCVWYAWINYVQAIDTCTNVNICGLYVRNVFLRACIYITCVYLHLAWILMCIFRTIDELSIDKKLLSFQSFDFNLRMQSPKALFYHHIHK